MTLGIGFSTLRKISVKCSSNLVKSSYNRVTEGRGETEEQVNSFYLTAIPQLSSFLQVLLLLLSLSSSYDHKSQFLI